MVIEIPAHTVTSEAFGKHNHGHQVPVSTLERQEGVLFLGRVLVDSMIGKYRVVSPAPIMITWNVFRAPDAIELEGTNEVQNISRYK